MAARKDDATRAVEVVADRALADLSQLLANLERAIARALGRLAVDDAGRVRPRHELGNLTTVRQQVIDAIEAAGGRAVSILDRRTLQAAKRAADLSDIPDEFKPEGRPAIRAIVEGRTREIARAFDAERSEVVAAINAGVAGAQRLDVLIGRVAERAEVAMNRARTLVDTGVMGVGRSVVADLVERANDDVGAVLFVMRYVGPLDSKTRPFCRRLLVAGEAYTREAIDTLDNGQVGPVSSFCGGWSCRHGWAPMPLAEARRRGIAVVGLTGDD